MVELHIQRPHETLMNALINDEAAVKSIRVAPYDAALGAEVKCGDLRRIDGGTRTMLRQAWLDNLLLVFRGQTLQDPDLLEVSTIFGETAIAAVKPRDNLFQPVAIVSNVVENGRKIGVLGDGEVVWHSDHSFHEKPLSAALLYALEVPPAGGDTHFSNMYLALKTLPRDLRARIEGLTIKNDGSLNSAGERRTNDIITDVREYVGVSHPIIRTHESGFDVLYLGRRPNAYVNGLPVEESEELLDRLWAHATQPAFTWAHHWQVGDLVVWDNRCVMHRRDPFDPQTRRIMHRAQCEGERPVRTPGTAAHGFHPSCTRASASAAA